MTDKEIKSTGSKSADFSVTDHILAASEKVAKTWRGGSLSGRAIAVVGGGFGLLADAAIQTILLILKGIPVVVVYGASLASIPAYPFKGKLLDLRTEEISLTAELKHAKKIAVYILSFTHVPIVGLINPSWAASAAQIYGYGRADRILHELVDLKQKIEKLKKDSEDFNYLKIRVNQLKPTDFELNLGEIDNLNTELEKLLEDCKQVYYGDTTETEEKYSIELITQKTRPDFIGKYQDLIKTEPFKKGLKSLESVKKQIETARTENNSNIKISIPQVQKEINGKYDYLNDRDFCENIVKKLPKEKIDEKEIDIEVTNDQLMAFSKSISEIHHGIFEKKVIPYDVIIKAKVLFHPILQKNVTKGGKGGDNLIFVAKELFKKLDGATLKKIHEIVQFNDSLYKTLNSKKTKTENETKLMEYLVNSDDSPFLSHLVIVGNINTEINRYYEISHSLNAIKQYKEKLTYEINNDNLDKNHKLTNSILFNENLEEITKCFLSLINIVTSSKSDSHSTNPILDMNIEQRTTYLNKWNKLKESQSFQLMKPLFDDNARRNLLNAKTLKKYLIKVLDSKIGKNQNKLKEFRESHPLWKEQIKDQKLIKYLCDQYSEGKISDIDFRMKIYILIGAGVVKEIEKFLKETEWEFNSLEKIVDQTSTEIKKNSFIFEDKNLCIEILSKLPTEKIKKQQIELLIQNRNFRFFQSRNFLFLYYTILLSYSSIFFFRPH
jgi:hypothetical protein